MGLKDLPQPSSIVEFPATSDQSPLVTDSSKPVLGLFTGMLVPVVPAPREWAIDQRSYDIVERVFAEGNRFNLRPWGELGESVGKGFYPSCPTNFYPEVFVVIVDKMVKNGWDGHDLQEIFRFQNYKPSEFKDDTHQRWQELVCDPLKIVKQKPSERTPARF